MEHVRILQREEIPTDRLLEDSAIDQIADNGDRLFIQQVEKNLGYTPPTVVRQRILQKGGKKRVQQKGMSLGRAIRALGIKPFTTESVEEYKRTMCWGKLQLFERVLTSADEFVIVLAGAIINAVIYLALGETLLWALSGVGLKDDAETLEFLPLVFMISPFFWGVAASFVSDSQYDIRQAPLVGNVFAFLSFGSTMWILCLFGSPSKRWELTPLKGYEKDIPHHVLETIALVHAKCPSAVFFVDELVMYPDPFLKVALDHEEYYLEVWNEPRFTAKRVV